MHHAFILLEVNIQERCEILFYRYLRVTFLCVLFWWTNHTLKLTNYGFKPATQICKMYLCSTIAVCRGTTLKLVNFTDDELHWVGGILTLDLNLQLIFVYLCSEMVVILMHLFLKLVITHYYLRQSTSIMKIKTEILQIKCSNEEIRMLWCSEKLKHA